MLANLVDRANVGMIQRRRGARLAQEPLVGLLILGHPVGQELKRHEAAQRGILGLVDDTHAPAAELLQDAVVRYGLAHHVSEPIFAGILGWRNGKVNT